MRPLGTQTGSPPHLSGSGGAGGFVIIRWSTSAQGRNQGRVAEDSEVGDPASAWRDWDAFLRQTAQMALAAAAELAWCAHMDACVCVCYTCH